MEKIKMTRLVPKTGQQYVSFSFVWSEMSILRLKRHAAAVAFSSLTGLTRRQRKKKTNVVIRVGLGRVHSGVVDVVLMTLRSRHNTNNNSVALFVPGTC